MNTGPGAPSPVGEGRRTTFDVRVWDIQERPRKGGGSSWLVRWKVAGRAKPNSHTFRAKRAAESRHAQILTAARRGEAFDVETGLPVSELREHLAATAPPLAVGRTWLEVTRDYADSRWDLHQAPGTRHALADALATATPALLTAEPPDTVAEQLRPAMFGWIFRAGARRTADGRGGWVENEPPAEWEKAVSWLATHSKPINDLTNPENARAMVTLLDHKINGSGPAAGNTAHRKRVMVGAALTYAVARGDLDRNPFTDLHAPPPKLPRGQVDRRVVINHAQGRRLLAAVRVEAPRMVAWFGTMYYAACRPGEVREIRRDDLVIPPRGSDRWGELLLATNDPEVGAAWNDGGQRTARALKHRAPEDRRPVPVHPLLTDLYWDHLDEFGTAPDGRLFFSPRDAGPVAGSWHIEVWKRTRARAFTPAEVVSPLAARPYDLRHACLSEWLNAGVPVTRIAEWAGHSVAVLMRTYAQCIVGQDELARKLIDTALRTSLPAVDPIHTPSKDTRS